MRILIHTLKALGTIVGLLSLAGIFLLGLLGVIHVAGGRLFPGEPKNQIAQYKPMPGEQVANILRNIPGLSDAEILNLEYTNPDNRVLTSCTKQDTARALVQTPTGGLATLCCEPIGFTCSVRYGGLSGY